MRLSDSLKQLGRPVVFYPKLAAVFGIPESIFISHFVYWSDKGNDPEGWIYKSAEEIETETGLSYEQQRRIRKELTASSIGAKGRKIKNSFPEPVLEEKNDRTNHRLYFRILFDSLDRAFSQGQLFPVQEGHLDNVHMPLGLSPTATRTMSSSSISKSTTESTSKNMREAHRTFIAFFDEMATKIWEAKPLYDAAGFRNLKLALKVTDESKLERLALYFLADPKFRGYALDLKVFLSGGVMKALADQEKNDGFVKRCDAYVEHYLHPRSDARVRAVFTEGESMGDVIAKLAKKFSLPDK